MKGECRDVMGGVRLESGKGLMLFTEETREVLDRIRGGRGTALPRRIDRGDRQTVTGRIEIPRN